MSSEDKTSMRVCKHMNEDHPSSVYAMVLSTLTTKQQLNWKITNCQMTSVSFTDIHLSYVSCQGESCSKQEAVVTFDPPLTSASEYRTRIVDLHHQHMAPQFSWLYTDPLIRIIVPTCLTLGYITYFIQPNNIDTYIQNSNNNTLSHLLLNIITTIFTSSTTLYKAIKVSWYFAIIAHCMEGIYVYYQSSVVLKLKKWTSFQWFALVCLTGYPVTTRLLKFVQVQNDAVVKKKP